MTWNDLWNHGWFERLAEFAAIAFVGFVIGLGVGYLTRGKESK